METTTKPAIEIAVYPEMPPVAALLSKARAYLSEPEHWCQHNIGDGEKVCAVGSLAKFDGYDFASQQDNNPFSWSDVGFCAEAFLAKAAGTWPPSYNDAPFTTHADILALFDRAIAAALATGK